MSQDWGNQEREARSLPPLHSLSLAERREALLAGNQYAANLNQNEQSQALRHWLQTFYRQRWIILALLALILPLVAIESFRSRSIYEATAIIEVGQNINPMFLDKNGGYYSDYYQNTKAEAFILKTRPVLERAVIRCDLPRNPNVLDMRKHSIWQGAQLLLGLSEPTAKTPDNTDENPAALPPIVAPASNKWTLSPREKQQVAPYVGLLEGGVTVKAVPDTKLLKISFTHTNPEVAAQIATGVAESFIQYNFSTRTERYADTSDWLEEATAKLKAKVEQAEQRLANYSRANNIFSLEGKENLIAGKLGQLHDQVTRAETEGVIKQALYDEVKQGRVAQLPEAFADTKTNELRTQLSTLSIEAAQLSVRLGPRHPRLVEVRQQMEAIQTQLSESRALLAEKLKADYERSQREEQSLKAALDKAKGAAVQQNQAAIQYSILQQDLATAKTLYTEFLNRTSQANIQRAEQYNNVRLIEAAEVPRGPVGPNRWRNILLGLILSVALGMGLIVLREQFNTTVRTAADLQQLVPFPLLAVIPVFEHPALPAAENAEQRLLKAADDPQAAAAQVAEDIMQNFNAGAEAYRSLRSSLMLSTAGQAPKRILVTSGEPSAGKSTTLMNTAIALAQLNANVLLIDADMRRPRLHKIAQLKQTNRGLSTLLSSGAPLEDCIRPTAIENLSLLPCGPIPPNPSELISSDSMRKLLEQLSEQYDHILIDSPPLASVTDPLILSTLVDGVIVVVSCGQSRNDVLRRVSYDLVTVGAKVLGVVLNKYNVETEGYAYSAYYRYRYRYDAST